MSDLEIPVWELRQIISEANSERRAELLQRFSENPALPWLIDAIDQRTRSDEDLAQVRR